MRNAGRRALAHAISPHGVQCSLRPATVAAVEGGADNSRRYTRTHGLPSDSAPAPPTQHDFTRPGMKGKQRYWQHLSTLSALAVSAALPLGASAASLRMPGSCSNVYTCIASMSGGDTLLIADGTYSD